MSSQLNKVYRVRTIRLVATELGEEEEWLHEISDSMETEDGVIWSMISRTARPSRSLTSA